MSNKIECDECGNFIYENSSRCKCGWTNPSFKKNLESERQIIPVLRDIDIFVQQEAQKSLEEAKRLGISPYEYYKTRM